MAYTPNLIADMHAHFLPCVDHGAKNVEESIAMLTESYKSGVRYVVATHHYTATKESPEEFLKRRDGAARLLLEKARGLTLPEIALGAELTYFRKISSFFDLSPFCIGNTAYLLIEPPYDTWDSTFFEDVEQIILRQELIPVIAHVERFVKVAPKNYAKTLFEMGAVLQYNAEHFARFPKKAIKRIPKNAAVVFGSDMHDMQNRAPSLVPTLLECERFMPEEFFQSARDITEKIFGDKT